MRSAIEVLMCVFALARRLFGDEADSEEIAEMVGMFEAKTEMLMFVDIMLRVASDLVSKVDEVDPDDQDSDLDEFEMTVDELQEKLLANPAD